MTLALRPYQTLIVDFMLRNPRACVFAGMGLGKTISTLTLLELLLSIGVEDRPPLVLAPLRVARGVWPDEAAKWPHIDLEVSAIVGTEQERLAAIRKDAQVYTINYENIPWLLHVMRKKWKFGGVIADESTRLKNYRLQGGGIRAQFLSQIAHHRYTRFWYNLTGTPAPNGLIDLWGQMWFIDEGRRLGDSFTAFRNRWFYLDFNGKTLRPHVFAQKEIQERIADVCLTIDAADWFGLDKPIVSNIYVELPKQAMRQYRKMERELWTVVEGTRIDVVASIAATQKCLQMASGAVYPVTKSHNFLEVHDAKLEALDDILEDANGMPVMVAYHFDSDLVRLKARYKKGRELITKADEDDWNAGKIPILFIHPDSGGHGLNLQYGGNIIVFFSHWWALESYQQVIERIGPVRQFQAGLKRNVFIYHILARNTVDEDVAMRRLGKASVQEILLTAMKKRKAA